ncbi:hypothetical protein Tco_1478831, partial [Tanacetum coccineum]
RRMQLDDMEKASRLMLMAKEIQTKLLPGVGTLAASDRKSFLLIFLKLSKILEMDGVDNLLALTGTPDRTVVKHLLTFLPTMTVSAIAVDVTRLPTHALGKAMVDSGHLRIAVIVLIKNVNGAMSLEVLITW